MVLSKNLIETLAFEKSAKTLWAKRAKTAIIKKDFFMKTPFFIIGIFYAFIR
jgi:hypothetical protein